MGNSQFNAITDYVRLQNRNALSHAIRTAVALGVFEALDEGQKNIDQLVDETGADRGVLLLLLDVLLHTELLEKYGSDYALSAVSRLVPRSQMDFGDLYWCHLEEFVRTGVPLPDNDRLPHTEADYLNGAAACEWMMTPAAIDAAQVLDMGKSRTAMRILEIGCGSAVFGSTLIHRDTESRLVLMDTFRNLKRAEKTIESINLFGRVEFVEGDYRDFDLTYAPFDLVLACGIMHRHDETESATIFESVSRHLKRDGEFVIVDIFPGQKDGGVTRSIAALEIALRTRHGRLPDPNRFRQVLIAGGFAQIQFAHLPAPPHIWGLILAQRA